MHVHKHGVGASLRVTLQQSSFTLALLLILHKLFPDKSCKMVLVTPGWLFAGESVPRRFASQAASEAVLGSPVVTGACPQDLGPSLKAWVRGLLLQLEGSPLGTVQGSLELKRVLGTSGERGKVKVLPCLAMLMSTLKYQSDAMNLLLRRGRVVSTASATGRASLCLSAALRLPARCTGGLVVFRCRELTSAWGKGQH